MKKPILLLVIIVVLSFVQCESENSPVVDDIIESLDENEEESNDNTEDESGDDSDENSSDDNSENEEENSDENGGNSDGNGDNDDADFETCDNEDAVFNDDESSTPEGECAQQLNEGTIACIANGVVFESTGIYSGATYEEEEGVFVLGIIGGDGPDASIEIGSINQRGIAVTISSSDLNFDDLEVGVEYRGTNGQNLFGGGFEVINSYVKIVGCESEEIGIDFSPTAIIQFSKIDRDNQLLSGTFEFMALDSEGGNIYPVTEGTFTDIWYCNQATTAAKSRIFDGKLKQLLRQQ